MAEQDDQAQSLEAHRKYLQRYALFHLRDASLAEDAVQNTLIAALAQRDRFQGRSQLRTWLTGILKHKIIDLTRSRGRGLPAGAFALGEDGDSNDGSFTAKGKWVDPPADWGMPDAALESSQFWRVYQECCRRMSKRDALVFSMREVMGLSAEEICKKIEISTTNLHVILFRARLSLRSCITKNWFGVDHE
ncbi:MAG: sigma-70 family RNA polymerase sigma factor [Betaproteobacteria bacterium]|nr:sigma-70 family RNA polymerase sigma factor [Betaproteobacteria bacterium]